MRARAPLGELEAKCDRLTLVLFRQFLVAARVAAAAARVGHMLNYGTTGQEPTTRGCPTYAMRCVCGMA